MTTIDTRYLRRAFDRKASEFRENDFFHRETRSRIQDRLPLFKIEPNTILDLGGGTGELAKDLQQKYSEAQIISVDASINMAVQAQACASQDKAF